MLIRYGLDWSDNVCLGQHMHRSLSTLLQPVSVESKEASSDFTLPRLLGNFA